MTSQSSVSGSAHVTGSLAAVFGTEGIDATIIDATTNVDNTLNAHSAEHTETPGTVAAAVEKIEQSAAEDKAVEHANDSDDLREQVTEQVEESELGKPEASVGTAGRHGSAAQLRSQARKPASSSVPRSRVKRGLTPANETDPTVAVKRSTSFSLGSRRLKPSWIRTNR